MKKDLMAGLCAGIMAVSGISVLGAEIIQEQTAVPDYAVHSGTSSSGAGVPIYYLTNISKPAAIYQSDKNTIAYQASIYSQSLPLNEDCTVYVGLYKNGILESVQQQTIAFTEQEKIVAGSFEEVDSSAAENDYYQVKIFLWSADGTQTPITKTAERTIIGSYTMNLSTSDNYPALIVSEVIDINDGKYLIKGKRNGEDVEFYTHTDASLASVKNQALFDKKVFNVLIEWQTQDDIPLDQIIKPGDMIIMASYDNTDVRDMIRVVPVDYFKQHLSNVWTGYHEINATGVSCLFGKLETAEIDEETVIMQIEQRLYAFPLDFMVTVYDMKSNAVSSIKIDEVLNDIDTYDYYEFVRIYKGEVQDILFYKVSK